MHHSTGKLFHFNLYWDHCSPELLPFLAVICYCLPETAQMPVTSSHCYQVLDQSWKGTIHCLPETERCLADITPWQAGIRLLRPDIEPLRVGIGSLQAGIGSLQPAPAHCKL
jgi:hypothetical protein